MPIALASFLLPQNGNTFSLLEDRYLKGGHRQVSTNAERNAIHPSCLKIGMTVYEQDTGYTFQLATLSPITWVDITPPTEEVGIIDVRNPSNGPLVPLGTSNLVWGTSGLTYLTSVGVLSGHACNSRWLSYQAENLQLWSAGSWTFEIDVVVRIPAGAQQPAVPNSEPLVRFELYTQSSQLNQNVLQQDLSGPALVFAENQPTDQDVTFKTVSKVEIAMSLLSDTQSGQPLLCIVLNPFENVDIEIRSCILTLKRDMFQTAPMSIIEN